MPLIWESLVEVQGITVTHPLPGTALMEHSRCFICVTHSGLGLSQTTARERKKKGRCKTLPNGVYFP